MNVGVEVLFFHWIEYLQIREKIYRVIIQCKGNLSEENFENENEYTNFLKHVQANERLSARFCAFFIK